MSASTGWKARQASQAGSKNSTIVTGRVLGAEHRGVRANQRTAGWRGGGEGGRGAALEHEPGADEHGDGQSKRSDHEKAAVHEDGSPVEGVGRARYVSTSSTAMAEKQASESIGNGTPAMAWLARSVQEGPLWLHGTIGEAMTPM